MKKNLLKTSLLALGIFTIHQTNAQITFVSKNNLLHSEAAVLGSNANVRSGNSVAVVDVNFDGLDDIVKLNENRYVRIEYQQVGGTFIHVYVGDFGTTSGWGMSLADVDHNGYKDILYSGWGGGGAMLMKLNNTGTGVLTAPYTLPGGAGIAGQNCNFMDVNNDGWEDIFVCNDVDESMIWVNDGAGNFPAEQNNSVINFDVTPGVSTTPDEYDESGNYGSVWTDFDNDGDVDFYIAHCRQAFLAPDIRRTNVLFENNGNGTYTSNAAAHGLASNDQDWTAQFGDIDNDGDFDVFMTKHDVISRYYINNGGNFTISSNTIAFGSMPMQAQFEDFDNDGFVDLFISGDNDERMYRNNGNATFTDVTPANLSNGGNVLSFASGDLNHDGKIDLYASYGSTYNNPGNTDDIYWQNSTTNSNHFLTLNLTSAVSNKSGLGARAFIYGAWGVQTREVRASESYGTLNSFQLHFGLGSATVIDSVVVNWPSGVHTVIPTPTADEFLNVFEQNPCTLSGASVSPSGPQSICTGGSVTLTANATGSGTGYTYLWSNGATTQSVTVNTSGSYAVTVRENAQCQSTSSSVNVTLNPIETPTIAATGETNFCQGDSVLLTSTVATSYLWSNGATTQNIYATQSGTYSVTIQGLCQQWVSNSVAVSVNPAPAPASSDVTLSAPATTTLTATGNSISWYSAPTGGTLLGTGANYNTATINTDTVFYAQDAYDYGAGIVSGGKTNKDAAAYSGSVSNEYDVFVADTNCVLKTVKVYTDIAGVRTIELRSATNVVLQSVTVNIPIDSSIVTLNFNLTQGTTYRLGTNTAQNNTSFGYNAPRLMRNNGGTAFPYLSTFGDRSILRVTGTSQTSTSFYYYFYDWQIEVPPTTCVSERTPVHVRIDPVGLKTNTSSDLISVFPNPTSDFININLNAVMDVELEMVDMLGKKVYAENYTSNGAVKSIATSNFRKGAYEITIKTKGTIYHHKLIIQ